MIQSIIRESSTVATKHVNYQVSIYFNNFFTVNELIKRRGKNNKNLLFVAYIYMARNIL